MVLKYVAAGGRRKVQVPREINNTIPERMIAMTTVIPQVTALLECPSPNMIKRHGGTILHACGVRSGCLQPEGTDPD